MPLEILAQVTDVYPTDLHSGSCIAIVLELSPRAGERLPRRWGIYRGSLHEWEQVVSHDELA
jgi:hypothetical protein